MFGFKKRIKEYTTYSYDMNYLDTKKNDFETLLKSKEQLINEMCDINDQLLNLRNQIKAQENEFIGSAKLEIIEQHRILIQQMQNLFNELLVKFIIEECNNSSFKYHVIVYNIMARYKSQFMNLQARYKELNDVEFYDADMNLNRFYNQIKQIYYSFLANEYQYGLDKNKFRR